VIDKNYISFDYFIVQPFVENLIEVLLQKHIKSEKTKFKLRLIVKKESKKS
jgi:hypothetical protein